MTEIEVATVELREAVADYEREQAASEERLRPYQERRELAMRRLAALRVSHRRIAQLAGISHTRVNQVLATGRAAVPFAHLPASLGLEPTSLNAAVQMVVGDDVARVWTHEEIGQAIRDHGWPRDGLEAAIEELVTKGQLLSVDGGGLTLSADVASASASA